MIFAVPEAFFLMVLVAAAPLIFWLGALARKQALARFGNPELLERAGMAVSVPMRALKYALIVVGLTLLVVALAGPQWGATREKIERKGVDVVVILDTSLSMLAQDVAPDRMTKAKGAINKLVELMQGDRIGLVVFSGVAFTMCPITLDYGAARMFLDVIDTRTVPEPGTNVAAALLEAADNFDEDADKYKVIILISDGEHLEAAEQDPVAVATELAGQGIVIFTVGVGGPAGASIPVQTPDGVVDKVDLEGNVVITRLDEDGLRKIALAASGEYRRLDNRASGAELAEIYAQVASMEKKTFEEDYQVHFEDRFQWFIGAVFLCFLIEAMLPDKRRRK